MKPSRTQNAEYERGLIVMGAAINKFGYDCSKTIFSINHPKGSKETFKADDEKKFVQGCLDKLKSHANNTNAKG